MYFATGGAADGTGQAATYEASNVAAVVPVTTTTTAVYFTKTDESRDKIVFTHDNTTATTGHRCGDIAKAIAQASTAGPHHSGMVDMVDLDNSLFYGNLNFVTALAISLNTQVDFA